MGQAQALPQTCQHLCTTWLASYTSYCTGDAGEELRAAQGAMVTNVNGHGMPGRAVVKGFLFVQARQAGANCTGSPRLEGSADTAASSRRAWTSARCAVSYSAKARSTSRVMIWRMPSRCLPSHSSRRTICGGVCVDC